MRNNMCRTWKLCGSTNILLKLWIVVLFTYVESASTTNAPVQEAETLYVLTEPSDVTCAVGPARLDCVPSLVGARVMWRYSSQGPTTSDSVMVYDENRRLLANGSLYIQHIDDTVSGYYQCVATVDSIGTVISRVARVIYATLEDLQLVGSPIVMSVPSESNVLLPCGVVSNINVAYAVITPRLQHRANAVPVTVTWIKNGVVLNLDVGRMSITQSGGLDIDPTRPADNGHYMCNVSIPGTSMYRVSATVELKVSTELMSTEPLGAPKFVTTPRSVSVTEGMSVTLDCAAVGNPRPDITWLNNGLAIDLKLLDSRVYMSGGGSLHMSGVRVLDSGQYTCRAHNTIDSVDTTMQLNVLSPPRVTVRTASVRARVRGEAELPCSVKGKPQPTVSWYKDGDQLNLNNHDLKLVQPYTLRIQGVLAVDSGMFQCVAENSVGSSQAAVRLIVDDESEEQAQQTKKHKQKAFRKSRINAEDFLNSLRSTDNVDMSNEMSDGNFLHASEDYEMGDEEPTAVGPPVNLTVVIVKDRFVTLSWLPPELGADIITGYTVVYQVKGSNRQSTQNVRGTSRECNVAGLTPDTHYVFTVRTHAGTLVSTPSQSVETKTSSESLLGNTEDTTPLDIRVVPISSTSLRVVWENGAGDVYHIVWSEASGGGIHRASASSESGSYVIGGLKPDTKYQVTIENTRIETKTLKDIPLLPPYNVSVQIHSPGSIVVRWEAPPVKSQGGSLTGYKIRYRPLSSVKKKADSITTPADVRSTIIRGLQPNTEYQVRVCAINANGSGPFSEWMTVTTSDRIQDESRVPSKPTALTTRAGHDWISVTWSGVESEDTVVRGWILGWGVGVPDDYTVDLAYSLRAHIIKELRSSSEYVISLRATNNMGAGPPVYATVRTRSEEEGLDDEDYQFQIDEDEEDTDEYERLPQLIPPIGLKVIMLSGTTAVVYWTDSTLGKGQTPVDGRWYTIRYTVSGTIKTKYFNSTILNCIIDDLKPFTTYDFAVKLYKGGYESEWSMVVSNTSLESAPSTPPRDLAVTNDNSRLLQLEWQPPFKPNGVITGYVIMYSIAGRNGEWFTVSVSGDRRSWRLGPLRSNTDYQVKVQAKNSKGYGPATQPVTATTGDGEVIESNAWWRGGWLWAVAGGAAAALLTAAALALSLCARRANLPPLSPDRSTYQKSSASAGIKPPDLWIHHDQMELKQIDHKSHHSSTAGSIENASALVSSTLTLPRGNSMCGGNNGQLACGTAPGSVCDYEKYHGSLDKRHYMPTYVGSPSYCSDETARASPSVNSHSSSMSCRVYDCKPMSSMGGCVNYSRVASSRPLLPHPDQSTPLLSGGQLGSPQSSLGSQQIPCTGPTCATCTGSELYAAVSRGQYVAYEPLGHYTHRSSISGDSSVQCGSLQRRPVASSGIHATNNTLPHSFTSALPSANQTNNDSSVHSTPCKGSNTMTVGRGSSPFRKPAGSVSSSPNRLHLGPTVEHTRDELNPLTPTCSNERLNLEMANLEGLMKDLTAITQNQQYQC